VGIVVVVVVMVIHLPQPPRQEVDRHAHNGSLRESLDTAEAECLVGVASVPCAAIVTGIALALRPDQPDPTVSPQDLRVQVVPRRVAAHQRFVGAALHPLVLVGVGYAQQTPATPLRQSALEDRTQYAAKENGRASDIIATGQWDDAPLGLQTSVSMVNGIAFVLRRFFLPRPAPRDPHAAP